MHHFLLIDNYKWPLLALLGFHCIVVLPTLALLLDQIVAAAPSGSMSDWQGANVASARARVSESERFQNHETVEAALNRLSKAYQSAMECVAAWHRASASSTSTSTYAVDAPSEGGRERLEKLCRVGRTARKVLEDAVLLDPLVVPFLPSSYGVLQAGKGSTRQQQRPPPALTSASHQATVRQLAYLSLVNYSDLLLLGLPKSPKCMGETILDRGIVQPLSWVVALDGCWEEEAGVTIRKALVSLLDATDLDGTNPMTWLKLACLARRMGRVSAEERVPTCLLKHRRLERHALESAVLSLPEGVPTSPLAREAMEEWKSEQDEIKHVSYSHPAAAPEPAHTIAVEISRYSWSTLGRVLLRCCRDGSVDSLHSPAAVALPYPSFVTLHLSPILALPSTALACTCQFLDEPSIWKLEATCKALSFSVLSARTTAVLCEQRIANTEDAVPLEGAGATASDVGDADSAAPNQQQSQKSRTSKRLQTQLMTSGRRLERTQRRTSAEFCLVSATLGLCPESKTYVDAKRSSAWESWRMFDTVYGEDTAMDSSQRSERISDSRFGGGHRTVRRGNLAEKLFMQQQEARERLGDSSLLSFVRKYGGSTSDVRFTPLEVLFGFVAHVSLHHSDVYMTDFGGSMVLTSTLIECTYFSFTGQILQLNLTTQYLTPYDRYRTHARALPQQGRDCAKLVNG
jgi:hypothetical protein